MYKTPNQVKPFSNVLSFQRNLTGGIQESLADWIHTAFMKRAGHTAALMYALAPGTD